MVDDDSPHTTAVPDVSHLDSHKEHNLEQASVDVIHATQSEHSHVADRNVPTAMPM